MSYSQHISRYQVSIANQEIEKALKNIDKIRWLKQPRNKFLYYAEKGLAYHLNKQYDSSNRLLEQADVISEQYGKSVGDVSKSYLINPSMEKYKGASFEQFLLHYYKALNYLELNQINDAIVEVRKISLKQNTLKDNTKNKHKYNNDAFASILQGLLYEHIGEPNNAFISYRNALDLFKKKDNYIWYGVKLPSLLLEGFYRTGKKMSFMNEIEVYQREMKVSFNQSSPSPTRRYLYLFIESGFSPKKISNNISFIKTGANAEGFVFKQSGVQNAIPYTYALPANYSKYNTVAASIASINFALPSYDSDYQAIHEFTVSTSSSKGNSNDYTVEKILDIEYLAKQTLQEDYDNIILKSIGRNLIRMAIKATAASTIEDEGTTFAVTALVDILSAFAEVADTRSWRTLPSKIYYAKIPVEVGTNYITVTRSSNTYKSSKNNTVAVNVSNATRPILIKSVRIL